MKYVPLIALFFFAGFRANVIQDDVEEYALKAAFIYNFTKFIQWNNSSVANEFSIGVMGPSPILIPLNDIARSKTVKDKKIVLRQFSEPSQIAGCNLLFISEKTPYSLSEILEKVPVTGVLTVSEKEGYALKGTTINFVVLDSKLRFEVNIKRLNNQGLTASSQLLKLAIIVEE